MHIILAILLALVLLPIVIGFAIAKFWLLVFVVLLFFLAGSIGLLNTFFVFLAITALYAFIQSRREKE